MPLTQQDSNATVDRIAAILDAAVAIDVDDLERLLQEAHECDIRQIDDPPEPFAVSRQALRLFWRFRCSLESVEVTAARE